MDKEIIVSVVMPIYNEEKYIGKCVESLLLQDYPLDKTEWIFVDGMSKDKTREILNGYAEKYGDLIKVFDNPHRIVPYAMNIGIKNSAGKYIVRLDAHADYDKSYISKCVYYLDNTDADNVGGLAETKSRGFVGETIANMLSSKFGVGNSKFRTNGKSGYVDTVPFGAFRREVFSKWGGYDERLVRNQDNEMNYRIRKNGGKIYLADDIKLTYYCRDSVKGITDMAFKNGTWNVITGKLCPGAMGLRHFIPMCFVLSIILLTGLSFVSKYFAFLFAAEGALYLLCDVFFSIKASRGIRQFFLSLFLFPAFHISYGLGSLCGIFKLLGKKYRKNGYKPEKI